MMFVSYFTPDYEKIMDNYLLPSLIRWSLPYYTEKIEDKKSWTENTKFKPVFIKQCLEKFNTPICWIDADAIVNKFPSLFWVIPEYDLAYHTLIWKEHYPWHTNSNKTEVLSGTLFLRNNNKIKQLLDKWIELTKNHNWEQRALEESVKLMPELKAYELPKNYCYITSTPRGEPLNPLKKDEIVIEHFQKGREMKRRK